MNCRSFTFFNMSCRSAVNKGAQLDSTLSSLDPDIAVLTETWLGDDTSENEFVSRKYNMLRMNHDRGWGIAVLYKSSLMCENCLIFYTWKVYFVNYRWEMLHTLCLQTPELQCILSYTKCNHKLISTGYFNFPNINWRPFSSYRLGTRNVLPMTVKLLMVVLRYVEITMVRSTQHTEWECNLKILKHSSIPSSMHEWMRVSFERPPEAREALHH